MKLSDEELTTLCNVIEQMVLLYENEKMSSIDQNIISDDELSQDPPPKEDCEVCMLPMPFTRGMCGVITLYQPCCGKLFCYGCALAETKEMRKGNMKECCAFCRVPIAREDEERWKLCMKRMKLNDTEAFNTMGTAYSSGRWGLPKDMTKAFQLFKHAADLGSVSAHASVGQMYIMGSGVEKDYSKAINHFKLAAIGGHERARHNLGIIERDIGNMNVAMKHFMIAARSGKENSLTEVGKGYKNGYVTKDEYASTLRAYQASLDEMKSEQRAEAAVVGRNSEYI